MTAGSIQRMLIVLQQMQYYIPRQLLPGGQQPFNLTTPLINHVLLDYSHHACPLDNSSPLAEAWIQGAVSLYSNSRMLREDARLI